MMIACKSYLDYGCEDGVALLTGQTWELSSVSNTARNIFIQI